MNTLADQTQRERALESAQSFIVQAPAGSGKTELLVRRYLSLLARVDAPERILAITFTKKASAEMRRRIVNALKLIKADGSAEDNPELRALAQAARANDNAHNWRVVEDTRRLRIQTIDSFCAELVRRMPWSARFGAPPKIIDDPAPLHKLAAKRALDHIEDDDEWSDACDQLLALVDANWSRAQSLLAGMLSKRDKWLRLLEQSARGELERMWQEVIESDLRCADALIDELVGADGKRQWIELGAFAAGNLRAEGNQSAVTALDDETEFPAASHQRIESWRGIAALVLTQAGALRKSVNVKSGFPPDQREAKGAMMELLRQLQQQPDLIPALAVIKDLLPNGVFSDAQWRLLDALKQMLRLAAGELHRLLAEQNQADFIEPTRRAIIALGEDDAPSDLLLRIDYGLTHILVDEFQDTSVAHIELLRKLTTGWEHGDGRTLFLVGDPMQSIYRFREAEVANFLKVRQDGLSDDIRPESIELTTNFRSAPQLVEWFNQTFEQVLPAQDDILSGAVKYAGATARESADVGAAHVHADINRDARQEAEAIADVIAEALAQPQTEGGEHDIAVLGRTRAHLHRVAEALRRRGIAFQAIDMERLAERPAIRDLTALTRALARDGDRIAWLAVLRALWCGLELADLCALADADPTRERAIVELCLDARVLGALSHDGQKRLRRFSAAIAPARARRGRIDLRRIVEAAWLCLGGPASVDSTDLDDCQRYLDLLGELESKRVEITAESLDAASENLWARANADSAVRVKLLTIHGAKGLQFHTVILPALGSGSRAAEKDLLQWKESPDKLLFAPLPPESDLNDRFYRYLRALDATEERNELGRLLYVACTRARKALHLFAEVKPETGAMRAKAPRANSFLHRLWTVPHLCKQLDAAVVAANAPGAVRHATSDAPRATSSRQLRRLPLAWESPTLPESSPGVAADALAGADDDDAIEFDWAGENARVVGIVLHWIFQQIDVVGWERWRAQKTDARETALWRGKLAEGGIAVGDLDDALAQLRDAVAKARADSRAAWIFSPAHRQVKTEWSLSARAAATAKPVAHFIIDRSFIAADGVRWIIDFKSSRHQGADADAFLDREVERYRDKMTRYAEVVGALTQSTTEVDEIKLGLYFPALQGWREWSAANKPE
ncbi:MAG: UvrD-helicase domain-containing protein [bacterium]